MKFVVTSSLCLLAATAGLAGLTSPALAQGWSGGAPVFRSDVERRQRQLEEQRAERRKAYKPVKDPRYMDGGAKPQIAPETPPIVYLSRKE